MKKLILVALAILLMFVLSACACEHEWKDATCLEPQICSLCEETQGEPNGHNWKNATCVDPQVCSVCKETQGEPDGHKWNNANCLDPQICSVCKATQGDPLGHTVGEAEFKENDYVNATAVFVKKCTICGEEVENTEEPLETLHNGEIFEISPYEFYKRLKQVYADIDDDIDIRSGSNGDQFVCGYLSNGKQQGILQFSGKDGNITVSQQSDACFDGILGIIQDDLAYVMASIVQTCDPTQTFESARSIAFDLVINGEKEVNGIVYQCRPAGDGAGMVWVDIKK